LPIADFRKGINCQSSIGDWLTQTYRKGLGKPRQRNRLFVQRSADYTIKTAEARVRTNLETVNK
jgi:hypothetical protein